MMRALTHQKHIASTNDDSGKKIKKTDRKEGSVLYATHLCNGNAPCLAHTLSLGLSLGLGRKGWDRVGLSLTQKV